MRKYIITGITITFLLWIGFKLKTYEPSYPKTYEVIHTQPEKTTVSLQQADMDLYVVDSSYKPSLYEPSDGCYIGAYVLANSSLNYDMLEFEKVINKKHSTYIYNLTLGNPFPTEWVLECIANMKTPLIVINPNENMILNEAFLYEATKDFGKLTVPMFVEFYPNPEKYDILPDDYKKFYLKAKEIFKTYSPNTAFIWSVNINNVYNSRIYYPGDNAVDWVGLSIYEPIYSNGNKFNTDIWTQIDFFYNQYQKSKPIMITQFGVSNYSNVDHTYYIDEAESKINEFYSMIKNKYPRIKGVNYMNFSGDENYNITDNENIKNIYKMAVESDYFKYNVDLNDMKYSKESFKSAFPIAKSDEDIYISSRALEYELNINGDIDNSVFYENMYWYPLNVIKNYKDCDIQIEDKKILVYLQNSIQD